MAFDLSGYGVPTGVIVVAIVLLLVFKFRKRDRPMPEKTAEELIEAPKERVIEPADSSDVEYNPAPPEKPAWNPKPTAKKPGKEIEYYTPHERLPKKERIQVSHIEEWFLPVANQGKTAACGAFAATSIYEHFYNRDAGEVREKDAKRSELFLYYNAREDKTKDCGSENIDIANSIVKDGCCDYGYWRYDDKWSEYYTKIPDNEEAARKNALKHCVKDVKALPHKGKVWIETLREGNPILIQVKFPKNLARTDKVFAKTPHYGLLKDKHTYHSMVIVGYDSHYPTEKGNIEAFRVRNSWGKGWGDGGYMWIEKKVLGDMTKSGGTYPIVLIGRTKR